MFGFVHVRRCGPDDFVLHERRPGEETFVVGHRNLQEAAAWIVRAQHNAV